MKPTEAASTALALFKPASPMKAQHVRDLASPAAAADYRLDLTLQNLLAIGAEFSPEDILSLRRRARYGDPRWIYSLYDEMMRLGPAPQVLKAREALKDTQTIWLSTPEEADEDETSDDPEDKAARLIRDVTEEAWGDWIPDLKNILSKKFFYGLAACQVMWEPKAIEGRWSKITDIRPIPARRFRLDPVTLRFKFLADPYQWEGPFVDDLQKTGKLVFVETGADEEPLDQRGLLFQCLIAWAIEQYTVRWRAKRLQNFGMPPVMVEYPKNDPAAKAVADLLADVLSTGTRASVPEGLKASLLAAPGAGSRGGDPYESNIEWCARQYDQTILGHSQVSGVQVGAGSRSSSKDAVGLFKDVTNSRAGELDVDLEQQCFRPYVGREFGNEWARDHTPKTKSSVVERDDPAELSAVGLNLFNAGAAGSIAVEDLVERCTLKVPEDGELTLAGNIAGQQPNPAQIGAMAKAQPPGLGNTASYELDGEGKPVQTVKPMPQLAEAQDDTDQPASPGALAKGSKPGMPGAKAASAPKQGANYSAMADFVAPARALVRKRKGRKARQEFFTRRQRFAAAALVGGNPRVRITSFGYENGAPEHPPEGGMTIDVRHLAGADEYPMEHTGRSEQVKASIEKHPMTHAIYGGVKSQALRAIGAAKLTGDADANLFIGCEHGKHRSVYVAERLGNELRMAGHDATVTHRDADSKPSGRLLGDPGMFHVEHEPRFVGIEQFYSEDQPRDHGRWAGGGPGGKGAESAATQREHRAASDYHERAAKAVGGLATKDNVSIAMGHREAAASHRIAADAHANAVGGGMRNRAREISARARQRSEAAHAATRAAIAGKPYRFAVEDPARPHPAHRHDGAARIAAAVRAHLKIQRAVAAAKVKHAQG